MTTEIDLIQDKNPSEYHGIHSCFRNFEKSHVLEKEKKIKGKFTVYQPVLTEQMTSTEKCDFWDTCKGLMLLTGRCQGTAALGNDPT